MAAFAVAIPASQNLRRLGQPMKIAKFRLHDGNPGVGVVRDDVIIPLNMSGNQYQTLTDILEADAPHEVVDLLVQGHSSLPLRSVLLEAPIDRQEVWAAGVTYKRSRSARMEESAAAADCYDRVYASPRPEIFFKASPHRVSGHGQPLRIRYDAKWNVPEPELTLVLNSHLRIVGYTVGNDMSSRDIEGENPLYLPQAKVYNQCCGLGPWIALEPAAPPAHEMGIHMQIVRGGKPVFQGATTVANMARSLTDLVEWLGRDNSFPHGAFLLTGTGVVPDKDFTLHPGDIVGIKIDHVGVLENPIVQG